MSKEKQIDEMLNEICTNCHYLLVCEDEHLKQVCRFAKMTKALYDAGYRKQSEWISVHDKLPAMGENVLCFENGKFYIAFFEKFEEGAWWDWVAFDRDDTWNEVCPSYWMPLPEPLKGV